MLREFATLHGRESMHCATFEYLLHPFKPVLAIALESEDRKFCDGTARSIYTLVSEVYTISETSPYTSMIDMEASNLVVGEIFVYSIPSL